MLVNFSDIEKEIEKTYIVSDKGLLKLILATFIANKLPVSSVWLFIVGASGSGKTQFIDTIASCAYVYPISKVSPNTFLSGFHTGSSTEASFLMQIPIMKGAMLLFKDFTTILSMNSDAKIEILGQMREIYDGTLTKRTGTGENLHWPGRVGVIAATTDAIYQARSLYSAMGERFIMYNPITPERKEVAHRAMNNLAKLKDSQVNIRKLTKAYIEETIKIPEELPTVSEEIQNNIVDIAEMTCTARSIIDRDPKTKEILHVYLTEMPTRMSEQLLAVAMGLMIINDNAILTEEDEYILYKIALDSIASSRRIVMQALTKYSQVETRGLAIELRYPTATVRRWLEDLVALKVADRCRKEKNKDGSESKSSQDLWELKSEYKELIAKYDKIEIVGGTLEGKDELIIFDEDSYKPAHHDNSGEEIVNTEDEFFGDGEYYHNEDGDIPMSQPTLVKADDLLSQLK